MGKLRHGVGSSFLIAAVPAFSDTLIRAGLLAQSFRSRYGPCPSGLQSAGVVGDGEGHCMWGALVAMGVGRPE